MSRVRPSAPATATGGATYTSALNVDRGDQDQHHDRDEHHERPASTKTPKADAATTAPAAIIARPACLFLEHVSVPRLLWLHRVGCPAAGLRRAASKPGARYSGRPGSGPCRSARAADAGTCLCPGW